MKKLILFLTALLCLGIQAEAQRPERGKRLSPEEMAEQRTAYMVQKYGLNQEQTNCLFELNKQQMEQMMQQRPPRISRDSLRKMDKEARKAYQKTMKEQGKNLFEKMKEREEAYRKALQDLGLDSDLSLELFIERQNYQTDIMDKLDCLFQEVSDVDGFFFSTHYLALEAIRYFINHQIDYQHRFHLGCFHETIALDVLAPEMCVTRMPIDKMGVEAVKILLDNIQEGSDFSFRNVVLENEFSPSFSLLGK